MYSKTKAPAPWTGEVVGKMHLAQVSGPSLAEEVGWHPKYLSKVLNGRVSPAGAEAKVKAALDRLIKEGA